VAQFEKFIPQNVATVGTRRIGVYNEKGNRIGYIPLGNLTPPTTAKKIYSFGALSDIHLQYDTAQEDFQKALTYLNDTEDVDFTCICGDLTSEGTAAELTAYKNAVSTYSSNTPVYAIMGNHDVRSNLMSTIQEYTGNPLYYSITHKNDVFIFVGNIADWTTNVLSTAELQWLYETLEANRNKRCFLFEHIRTTNGCGNALGLYQRSGTTDWGGTCGTVFESLLSHYHNIVFFHGHSHLKLYLQEYDDLANYDNMRGCHSVHIPSLAVPRDDIDDD
jgi:DNA repair exonuclease SbcCD nuclease subunit